MTSELRLVVLISGEGTNLQAVIDACASGTLPARVVHVFSNKAGAGGLAVQVARLSPDIVVLAGWMRVLTSAFLSHFKPNQVINLHPALPGCFPGTNAIERALVSTATRTGAMCHTVVEEVDAGTVLSALSVPIHPSDTLGTLTARVQSIEKTVLLLGIMKATEHFIATKPAVLVRRGKVRDVYSIGRQNLMMVATDRFSCFDRAVCEIPQKGGVLNRLSAWWFSKTSRIVRNHLMYVEPEHPVSFVRECRVFPVEFVVRAFITGATNTSMWTLYQRGERRFGGDVLSDGMRKNERLPRLLVTPTTKSDTHDEPIADGELPPGITREQYQRCTEYALRLFAFGQSVALERGLLLVDTKYEFGLDHEGIVLVDEIHTCDSSRFWEAASYEARFASGQEPERFDKDIIRNWVRERCDPYSEEIPEVPESLIRTTSGRYIEFYERLTGERYEPGFPVNSVTLSAAISAYWGLRGY